MSSSSLTNTRSITDCTQKSRKTTTCKVYKQHYRKDWEQIPEFKDWISEKEGNREKVYCKVCKKTLHAHKISLIKHTISLKHTKLAQQYLMNQVNNEKTSDTATVNRKLDEVAPQKEHVELLRDNNLPEHTISCDKRKETPQIDPKLLKSDQIFNIYEASLFKNDSRPKITTHVLDTSRGLPAASLSVSLYQLVDSRWTLLKESMTNADGRCQDLTSSSPIHPGRYKLHFETENYFNLRNTSTFYPFVEIVFDICSPQEHYHVPLLLSPFGYSTYRGS